MYACNAHERFVLLICMPYMFDDLQEELKAAEEAILMCTPYMYALFVY